MKRHAGSVVVKRIGLARFLSIPLIFSTEYDSPLCFTKAGASICEYFLSAGAARRPEPCYRMIRKKPVRPMVFLYALCFSAL